ncbi:uncharacterized protein LOC126735909 [Anthonomus grandis grandis]|uniref:uncharacterized protein LOC126735909 n=1 Tax=Anthonomus grandis grandis TaxID=2921223 RepID=UPI0021656CCE|nr:uncharacterized protein LOC126735909 [Anthonomus grandis grandis]XP_050295985.1 uncharacterized protein LOC126735909 [Anthonomus grandis grandis]
MDVSFTNVLEGARQYFQGLPSASAAAGPYYQQNVQHEQPANHHQQPQQHNQQQHHAYYQPQNHERYGNTPASAPVSTGNSSQWIQQQSPSETRPPTRENTPIQRSASRNSSNSRPPSHPSQYQDTSRLYQNPYPPQEQQMPTHTSQANFHFSRPQSRDVPTTLQYQMPAYHQSPSSQLSRPASKEQISPSRQTYQSPQSSGHSLPVQNTYSYQPTRAYYSTPQGQPTEAKPVTTSVTSQSYYTSQSHCNTYQQSENSSLNTQNNVGQYQQNYRTHNLPPIAGLSNYRPSKNTKDIRAATIPRMKTSAPSNTYLPSTQQQSVPVSSSSASAYPYASNPSYTMYNNTLNQNNPQRSRPEVSTVITQTYTNVIVTSHYSNVGTNQNRPYQRAEVQNLQKTQPTNQTVNYPKHYEGGSIYDPQATSVIKQRKETPLDLSVKTVRTSADSTDQEASRKFATNKPPSVVSNHSYPTLDINSIQRSFTQRSQLPAATAPKVEFHPKFNLASKHSSWIPVSKSIDNSLAAKNVVQATSNAALKYQGGYQFYPTTAPKKETDLNGGSNSLSYQNRDYAPKRPAQVESPMIPSKIPRVDNWRESINLQIEQKFTSHYKQQEQQKQPFGQQNTTYSNSPTTINGNYSHYDKPSIPSIPQQNQQFYAPHKPNQNYVHSAASQAYPGYLNSPNKQQMYINPVSKHYTQLSKPNSATGADKRVLSLLRNSIEIKEQKKIELLKSNEVSTIQRTDVQHPSTDVTAPLQPKPGIDRNNVSPFTPISVPDPNICKMPPKMSFSIDAHLSHPLPVLNKAPSDERTVIMNNPGADYDGLAAFLAARIRTKGELKEVVHSQAVNNNADRDARLHAFLEDTIKSPNIQNMNVTSLSTSTTLHASPPKMFKDKQNVFPPRKKLFSRNEDDCKQSLPGREKSNMRSSSETSVFDFNDSDDENEMPVLERQSLGEMRKDKRNSLRQSSTSLHNLDLDIKAEGTDVPPRLPTPEDDLFGSICDKFMEQLKNKSTKRIKRISQPTDIKSDSTENVKIKIEIIDDEFEEAACDVKVDEKPVVLDITETPKSEKEISDSEMSDSEIKVGRALVARNRDAVRRKIVLSSESDNGIDSITVKTEPIATTLEAQPDNKSKEDSVLVEVKSEPSEEKSNQIEEVNLAVKPEEQKEEGQKLEAKKEEDKLEKPLDVLAVVRPAKKPAFGDGSDFYPGWEEGLYRYKKSLRMPPSLIQLTQPPYRLSTSLPDLDPCPQSPASSIITDADTKDSISDNKKTIKRLKSELPDSDSESTTSSFNIFSKKINYDSEESASIKSLPNTRKENMSILDKLLEKCGGKKKRKYKRKEDHSPKVIPKAENPAALLPTPTPGLALSSQSPEKSKGLTTPVISAASAVLPFRKDTVNNFKDAFINSGNNILGVHDKFTTIVLSSRTRKETRALKQRATIKEVFGEDRPASAPPDTCVDQNKAEREQENVSPFSRNLEEILINKEKVNLKDIKSGVVAVVKSEKPIKENTSAAPSVIQIKQEVDDEDEEENRKLSELIVKKDPDAGSETLSMMSLDDEDSVLSGKKKSKFGKMRRKFSSGFDYIRKKKKVKKEEPEEKKERKKKITPTKAPESIDDIQKEIKSWVLNKGVGESHLHRAARLGYADITAYCLEKLANPPSPKDNAGYTPLHEACSRGHLEIARLLLKYGANVHESAKGGVRPLHEAIENGFIEIVRLLLSYGADPHLATYAGVTPLSLATEEIAKNFLKDHLSDKAGAGGTPWPFYGPASCFDPEESGYDVLQDAPEEESDKELEDIEIEMSDALLPNLYTIVGEPPTDRWVLLQDLSHFLKLKSRDALLKQLSPTSSSSSSSGVKTNYKNVIKELKMSEFLEQAHCCQFLNMGEKINTRASKIALVKYSDRVRELLGIENAVITAR